MCLKSQSKIEEDKKEIVFLHNVMSIFNVISLPKKIEKKRIVFLHNIDEYWACWLTLRWGPANIYMTHTFIDIFACKNDLHYMYLYMFKIWMILSKL